MLIQNEKLGICSRCEETSTTAFKSDAFIALTAVQKKGTGCSNRERKSASPGCHLNSCTCVCKQVAVRVDGLSSGISSRLRSLAIIAYHVCWPWVKAISWEVKRLRMACGDYLAHMKNPSAQKCTRFARCYQHGLRRWRHLSFAEAGRSGESF